MKKALKMHKDFQNEIFRIMKEEKVSIMFLKFEELRSEPRDCLMDVFRFLLNKKDLSGTYIEHRIDQVLALGHEATLQYKLKKTDKKFNAIDRYTPE